ncbi:2-deoxystreptamine glucosyltransferase [bacterium HR36]|nr:2-deoxystreptamine glucosyltransferase [bacterium HR36]
MLRVLDVRVLRGRGGGPEKTLAYSAPYLARLGYEMICVYLCDPKDEDARSTVDEIARRGTRVYMLDDTGPLDITVPYNLYRLVDQLGISIYHGHDYKSNVLGCLLGNPCIRVTTLHGWVHYTHRLRYYYAVEKWCLRKFARAYCVSQELYRAASRLGLGSKQLYYLPNGIIFEEYRRVNNTHKARAKLGIPHQGFCLGAVGRLSEEKNFSALLMSVRVLRRAGFPVWGMLVGDGPLRQKLERQSYEQGIRDHIVFAGYQRDIRPWLECMDVYLCTSTREGMPNSVLEAMAMEVPIIATRVGEVPYMITHGREGVLLPSAGVEEIVKVVTDMIRGKLDKEMLAKQARTRVETEFNFDRRMRLLAADYDKLIAQYGRRARV